MTAAAPDAMTIIQVDAFTTERCGGNPRAVVLDADELTDEGMQAREMNLSETAFVMRSRAGGLHFPSARVTVIVVSIPEP